jgi:hypothetical protein
MLTRFLPSIAFCALLSQCSSLTLSPVKAPSGTSPLAWCGTYHFNASDTDFMSTLEIKFYPNRGEEFTEWFADGTISDSMRRQKLAFKHGFVNMTEVGPEIHCINLNISPFKDDSGQKSFWIDHREHLKDDGSQIAAQKAQR